MSNAKEKLSKQEKQKQSIEKCKGFRWFLQTNKESIVFISLNILFITVITIAIVFSVLDKKCGWVKWDTNAIGVLCQIITAIVSFVSSTIGIAITLQKEECWGVSVKEFNNIRVGLRYPIVVFITLSIAFSALNAGFYVANLIIASIGVALVAILFCTYVSWCEIPQMLKSERALIRTVKNRLLKEWGARYDLPKDLKAVLKYLIVDSKNLKITYELLKSKNKSYNQFLIHKLLEIQCDASVDLTQLESKQQQIKWASSLFDNVKDLINFNLDLSCILEEDFVNYKHSITRVLFRLNELPEYEERTAKFIADMLVFLKYKKFPEEKFSKEKVRFIMSIILSMSTISIWQGNFSFVKALQEKVSINHYELGHNNYESIVFALVSMQFYFLCHDSQNASPELKESIKQMLCKSGIVNHIQLYPWTQLYIYFSREFKIDFSEFMYYFSICEDNLDVPRYYEAQWVQLDLEYAVHWYLIHLLNSHQVENFDYSTLCLDDNYKFYIKDFWDKHFDDNKKFAVSDDVKSILDFFSLGNDPLKYFLAVEERSHSFFTFINNLKKTDLLSESSEAVSKENEEIAEEYKKVILDAIQNEWGYDSGVQIGSSLKTKAVLLEKVSKAINYKDVMSSWLINLIFNEIRIQLSPEVITRSDEFDKDINSILSDDIVATSKFAELVPHYLQSDTIKKQFEAMCSKVSSFESRILPGCILVKEKGFAFNVDLVEFNLRDLTKDELSKEVESYKRADGQYVYEGVFFSREEIEKHISEKYAVLRIAIRYGIQTADGAIIEIQLF